MECVREHGMKVQRDFQRWTVDCDGGEGDVQLLCDRLAATVILRTASASHCSALTDAAAE